MGIWDSGFGIRRGFGIRTAGFVVITLVIGSVAGAQGYVDDLKQRAERGDTIAQCFLANAYRKGLETRQDYAQALAWYRKLVGQDDSCGHLGLGQMLLLGEGVPVNQAEGITLLTEAADRGIATAMLIVGRSYEGNFGVKQDYQEAARWYRDAIDVGTFTDAMVPLALLYAKGNGVPRDPVEAHKWLNIAAARAEAADHAQVAALRDEVATQLTPEQLAEAQKRAREWLAEYEKVSGVAGGVFGGVVGGTPLRPPPPVGAVRVGGNIQQPSKLKDVKPEYPAIAQSARVQGVVILEATIGSDGKVVDATVLRSIPLLDQAAIDAVKQWEFSQTLLNGVPVPVIMTVTVTFTLR